MAGDDRVRFCRQCWLYVYNLSEMSRQEAEALVREKERRRVCVRFYRRADGTIITRDCPVGLWAARRKAVMGIAVAAMILLACLGYSANRKAPPHEPGQTLVWLRQWEPFRTVLEWLDPTPPDVGLGW
jgi:hypothetical protein